MIDTIDTRCICFVMALALAATASGVVVDDVGPNTVNGVDQGEVDTAGLTPSLAGSQSGLYAVSLNAGVWKSVNGGAWTQLSNSPPRAYSIAADPQNGLHLAVGERDGD